LNSKATTIAALVLVVGLAGCAPRQGYVRPSSYSQAPSSTNHAYEIAVKNSANEPIQGAQVEFTLTSTSFPNPEKSACTSDANGICKASVNVFSTSTYSQSYNSKASYKVSMPGYYSDSGELSSSWGSSYSKQAQVVQRKSFLYKPADYLAESFLNTTSDRELRDKAIKFVSTIRLQSLLVDADLVVRGMDVSKFKAKKYLQLKINTTTSYNSLKLDKYGIAKRIFDDSLRKILNPLNEDISNPRTFYGYDLVVYGYTKDFSKEYALSDKIEYRFLMPQESVRQYKNKDISGQQLLDASVILMNDERIDLKLQ